MPMICLAVTKHSTSVQTLTSLTVKAAIGSTGLWRCLIAAGPGGLVKVEVQLLTGWSFSCFAGQYEENSALWLQPKAYFLNPDQRVEYLCKILILYEPF